MKYTKHIIIGLLSIALFSCEKVLMEPTAKTDSKSIFNEYATLVKEKYAMLEFKKVDIQHLQDSISNTISSELTEKELFDKLTIITQRLKDGHTHLLKNSDDGYTYDFISDFPVGFHYGILADNYLAKSIAPNIKAIEGGDIGHKIVYGFTPQSSEIAYMWIPSWNVELSDDEIESVFSEVKGAKALIIDIRQNTGGNPGLATKFASYLTDKTIYTGCEKFKTGPGTNDFSSSKIYLEPSNSSNKFLKPVAVLTDRYCYSASTTFSYSVNPLEQVTFIGQRTGGGSGGVSDGFLANGWEWALSTSEFIDYQETHLDNGFEPDISVALDTLDKTQDEVIERALIELK
jgi:hypothetical protein